MRSRSILFFVLPILVYCSSILKAQTPDSAVKYYQSAFKKLDKGDFDGAIADYTRAIILSSHLAATKPGNFNAGSFDTRETESITVVDPFTANAYCNRGVARYWKHDYEGAIADFSQAIKIRPGLAQAYLNRAAAYHLAGNLTDALKDLDRAFAMAGGSFEGYVNRGSIKQSLGDLDGALADIQQALSIKPNDAGTINRRAYALLAQKKYDEAIADFDRAIQLDPSAAAYQGRGTTLMGKGELTRAIQDFTAALQRDPQLARSYLNRGLALLVMGRDNEAQKDIDECLALSPDLKAEVADRVQLAKELRTTRKSSIK